MEFTVRAARPDDARVIVRIARQSWHAAYDDIIGADAVDESIDEWYDEDRLATATRIDDTSLYVATTHPGAASGAQEGAESVDSAEQATDPITGFGQSRPVEGASPPTHRILRLYVFPEYWGTGAGTALLERLTRDAREDGAERLSVETLVENEVGVGFYQSRGFDIVETRDVDLPGGETEEHVFEKAI